MGGLILAGVMTDRALHQVPAENSFPYHARVRAASASMPEDIGDWRSQPVEVPTSAQKMLRSNVLISRQYTNQKTGAQASFLLVQCSDARDLSGHYPKNCYPNAGFTLAETQMPETLWNMFPADARPAPGDEVESLFKGGILYRFTQDTLEGTRTMWVFNLMVLPNGRTSPDMAGVNSIARDRRMRYFGAAEIQVITNVGMAHADRFRVINMLLGGARPLIDAIKRSGVVK
jgi:hypothetical protein